MIFQCLDIGPLFAFTLCLEGTLPWSRIFVSAGTNMKNREKKTSNFVTDTKNTTVVKTRINHPFGNGLYQIFMVIWGMVHYCFNHITWFNRVWVLSVDDPMQFKSEKHPIQKWPTETLRGLVWDALYAHGDLWRDQIRLAKVTERVSPKLKNTQGCDQQSA